MRDRDNSCDQFSSCSNFLGSWGKKTINSGRVKKTPSSSIKFNRCTQVSSIMQGTTIDSFWVDRLPVRRGVATQYPPPITLPRCLEVLWPPETTKVQNCPIRTHHSSLVPSPHVLSTCMNTPSNQPPNSTKSATTRNKMRKQVRHSANNFNLATSGSRRGKFNRLRLWIYIMFQ